MNPLSIIGLVALAIASIFLILVGTLLFDYLDRGDRSIMCKIFKKLFHKKRKNNINRSQWSDKRENLRLKIKDKETFTHSEQISQKGHY